MEKRPPILGKKCIENNLPLFQRILVLLLLKYNLLNTLFPYQQLLRNNILLLGDM